MPHTSVLSTAMLMPLHSAALPHSAPRSNCHATLEATQPSLAAPVLNHTPFAHRSTPQQASHRTRAHWPLPSQAQATHSHLMREPCRLFSRLALTDGMDRLSGGPLLQLGWVTRGARLSGLMSNGRARQRPGQLRPSMLSDPARHEDTTHNGPDSCYMSKHVAVSSDLSQVGSSSPKSQ